MALAWTGVLLAGAAAALVRYQLVEPPAFADRCAMAVTASGWCSARTLVVAGFLSNAFGYAALAATALALAHRRRWSAALAAALGAVALELYCYQSGALALLLGAVLLVGSRPQHSETREHVQAQP
jgi:hypothetical protein